MGRRPASNSERLAPYPDSESVDRPPSCELVGVEAPQRLEETLGISRRFDHIVIWRLASDYIADFPS